MLERLSLAGVSTATFTGSAQDVRKELARHLRATGAQQGFDDSGVSDAELTDNLECTLFPNTQMVFFARELLLFRHRPHPTDPLRFYLDHQIYRLLPKGAPLLPRPAHQQIDLQREPEMVPNAFVRQDAETLDSTHRGLRSRGFRGANPGKSERVVRALHKTLDFYLASRP